MQVTDQRYGTIDYFKPEFPKNRLNTNNSNLNYKFNNNI